MNSKEKDYSDAYLLTSPFHLVAKGWDSLVFIDDENPDVIVKLYDYLSAKELRDYYGVHKKYARIWAMKTDIDPVFFREEVVAGHDEVTLFGKKVKSVAVSILELGTGKEQIIEHEDGLLTVIPKVPGRNLGSVEEKHSSLAVEHAIKTVLRKNGMPVVGWKNHPYGHTIVPENIMVQEVDEEGCVKVVITDIGARILECLEVENKISH